MILRRAPPENAPSTAEVWVSLLIDGTTMAWRAGDTSPSSLQNAIPGSGFGMVFDASAKLYVTHGFTPDLQEGNEIEVFDARGKTLGSFG